MTYWGIFVMALSSGKIEARAISALQNIINQHETMDAQLNDHDKEMSWDGFIFIYRDNNKGQTKSNFDYRAAVQIKGHEDASKKYINKKMIQYAVEIDDLKAYATEGGVIYFEIFVSDTKDVIFYNCLYPSKVAKLIADAEKKGNKKSISITFNRLNDDCDALYSVIKQFSLEAKEQGSAFNPLVDARIKKPDIKKLTEVSLTTGIPTSYDTIKGLSNGDICLYGKTSESDKFFLPIEGDWKDELTIMDNKVIDEPVSINGKLYYEKFETYIDTNGNTLILLSPNLILDLSVDKVLFTGMTNIKEMAYDAKFLFELKKYGQMEFDHDEVKVNPNFMNKEFEEGIKYYVDLYETLVEIGMDTDKPVSEYTKEQMDQLTRLVMLRLHLMTSKFKENNPVNLDWQFGDKYFPITFYKDKGGLHLLNIFNMNDDCNPFVFIGGKGYRMPFFLVCNSDVLSNLLYYDYDAFKSQIDSADINKITAFDLFLKVIEIHQVYDTIGDENMLDLVRYLYTKIQPFMDRKSPDTVGIEHLLGV